MIGSLLGIVPVFVTMVLLPRPWIRPANVIGHPPDRELAQEANQVDVARYRNWHRVVEPMRFAERLGAKHLGIATYVGLKEESRI